jgi:hypothetical protein
LKSKPIILKDPKQKITIKIIRIKIEMKNKLEGKYNFFIEG